MRPSPAVLHDLSPEQLRQCLDVWHQSVAADEPLPRGDTKRLLGALALQPAAWIGWREDPGFPDEMVAHLWTECLTDVYRETDTVALARLATVWQAQPAILAASPILGTTATGLLMEAVGLETASDRAMRTFRTALRAVLEAAPRQAPARYSTGQLDELIDATAHRQQIAAPFIAAVADQLGIAPEVVRAAWVNRSEIGSRPGARQRLATFLDRAVVARQQGTDLVDDRAQFDTTAATSWSFYENIVSPHLRDEMITVGDRGVEWAWGHPAWRAALLTHATDLVLDAEDLWQHRRHVRVALETMAAHADAWPHDRYETIRPWLHQVAHRAPLDVWARVAAIVAAGTESPEVDTQELWETLTTELRARPREPMGATGWLPWLQASDGQIRAEAMLLAAAHPAPGLGASPRPSPSAKPPRPPTRARSRAR